MNVYSFVTETCIFPEKKVFFKQDLIGQNKIGTHQPRRLLWFLLKVSLCVTVFIIAILKQTVLYIWLMVLFQTDQQIRNII